MNIEIKMLLCYVTHKPLLCLKDLSNDTPQYGLDEYKDNINTKDTARIRLILAFWVV